MYVYMCVCMCMKHSQCLHTVTSNNSSLSVCYNVHEIFLLKIDFIYVYKNPKSNELCLYNYVYIQCDCVCVWCTCDTKTKSV